MRTPLPAPRPALAAGLVLLVAALAGCTGEAGATGSAPAPPVVRQVPASVAGGACTLLDYPVLEEQLGVRFDIAAASRVGDTRTCVVQAKRASRPDLTLSVIDKVPADPAIFADEMVPEGAKAVKGIGTAAYRLTVAPAKGRGAAAEIGWLTKDRHMVTLRYTMAQDGDKAEAETMAPRLVALGKTLDLSRLTPARPQPA